MTITVSDLRTTTTTTPTAPAPRRPIEQPHRLRMIWETVLDEKGDRRLRARWRREG